MSDRVRGSRVSKSRSKKTEQSESLATAVFTRGSVMPTCSSCESSKTPCIASEEDSSRCYECVLKKRGNCDMHGLTPAQMQKIARLHSQIEDELDAAEEEAMLANAKVNRLRKQRRLWAEKMARAVRRGIETIDELDRVEKEEAEAERARIAEQSAEAARRSSTEEAGGMVAQEAWLRSEGEVGVFDWSSVMDENVDWSGFGMGDSVLVSGDGNASVDGPSGHKD